MEALGFRADRASSRRPSHVRRLFDQEDSASASRIPRGDGTVRIGVCEGAEVAGVAGSLEADSNLVQREG
jgi:hypothetical protein